METNNDNIRKLMEMLDNPDAYSEQEISDIINRDHHTREAYRLMVEAKRSSRWKQHGQPADVDAAWQRFERQYYPRCQPVLSWKKVAASFVGLLLVSGIALAAFHIVRQTTGWGKNPPDRQVQVADSLQRAANSQLTASLPVDTATVAPVVFDNVPLDKMLAEMTAYYHAELFFSSDSARQLRFYFVWYKELPLQKVVETLNRFEHVDIVIDDDKLIVR